MHHHITETYSRCLSFISSVFYCKKLKPSGFFGWGFLGGFFFFSFSHIVREISFLFSSCVSSAADTAHASLADDFPHDLLVISIP